MEIKVMLKQVYGKDTYYPACERAHLFAKLTGSKTLTPTTLRTIRELGYVVKVEQGHAEVWQ